jgi:hypothetical protein
LGFNMTDKQQVEKGSPASTQTQVPVSRRTLLRGAAPAIVTLYSGAALAQSSNLISAPAAATAENNKYRCLDTASVYATKKPDVYDLGSSPMAHVTQIRSTKDYYPTSGYSGLPSGPEVTAKQMCTTGGNYVRKDTWGYTRVNVSRGVLVSATALNSFSDKVTYTDI